MPKRRKNFTPEAKLEAIHRVLVGGEALSDVCDTMSFQPSQFYSWQKTLFAEGKRAFERQPKGSGNKRDHERVAKLEAKLQKKNEVLSGLMEEHVRLKKSVGEL